MGQTAGVLPVPCTSDPPSAPLYLYKIAAQVLIGVGAQGESHVANTLRYCMVHTVTKWDIDPTPFFSANFIIPGKILTESRTSRAKLMKKPADPEEVKSFLFQNPGIRSWVDFSFAVDTALENTPNDIPMARLSQFLSKNGGRDGKKMVSAILDRREQCVFREENDKPYKAFLAEAHAAKCTCPVLFGLRDALISVIKFRDTHEEMFRDSKSLIGDFAESMHDGEFSDRCQTLYLLGAAGTGKSSVLNPFLHVVPDRRIFQPVYGSSTPFANMRRHHIIGNYQEFRISAKMPPNTLLLMLERAENVPIDVKGESSISVPRGPRNVMSSNYLEPRDNWTHDDISAIMDRVKKGTWTVKLPPHYRQNCPVNVLECKCKKCSVAFLCWCSPALARKLRATGTNEPLAKKVQNRPAPPPPQPAQSSSAPSEIFGDDAGYDYIPEEFLQKGFDEP